MANDPNSRKDHSARDGLLVGLLLAIIVVALVASVMPYPEMHALLGDQTQQQPTKYYPIPHASPMGDILGFFDDHGSAIAAAATVAVAWFTFSLRDSTNKLWSVSKIAADSAVGVELPRLILSDVDMEHLERFPRVALKTEGLHMTIANHGRTEAVVLAECFQWMVATELPPQPTYDADNLLRADLGTVIGPSATYELRSARGGLGMYRDIDDGQIGRVLRGEAMLWLYGFVVFRDFLNTRRIFGYCTPLEVSHAHSSDTGEIDRGTITRIRFVGGGPPAYTYQR